MLFIYFLHIYIKKIEKKRGIPSLCLVILCMRKRYSFLEMEAKANFLVCQCHKQKFKWMDMVSESSCPQVIPSVTPEQSPDISDGWLEGKGL